MSNDINKVLETLSSHSEIITSEVDKKKNYKCKNCNLSFEHQSHLTNHQRIHVGENLDKIKHAEELFNQNLNLATKQQIDDEEKTYKFKISLLSA